MLQPLDELERLRQTETRLLEAYGRAQESIKFYRELDELDMVDRYRNRLVFIEEMLGYAPNLPTDNGNKDSDIPRIRGVRSD